MNTPSDSLSLLVLGSGEIARHLVRLAHSMDYPLSLCARDAAQHTWPLGVTQFTQHFNDHPWTLPPHSHAIIAQGHDGDADSIAALLNHGAEHVYLIASAKRAEEVIETARPQLKQPGDIEKRLSSPAGLNLGGRASAEIALSVLAEIQWRHYQQDSCYPMTNRRSAKSRKNKPTTSSAECPGKRP